MNVTVASGQLAAGGQVLASGLAVRLAPGSSRAQGTGQLAAQFPAALDVESLVDRLVGHVHLRLIGEPSAKSVTDLFRAPPHRQVGLDKVPQFGVLADLAGLGPGPALVGPPLGGVRAIGPSGVVTPQRRAVAGEHGVRQVVGEDWQSAVSCRFGKRSGITDEGAARCAE